MGQESQQNIIRLPSKLDFFKSNIPFVDKLIEEDLNIICSSLSNSEINIKAALIENNLWGDAKESIVEMSIVFSGALELADSDYEDIKREILAKTNNEVNFIRSIRRFLMKSDPGDTKSMLIELLKRECVKCDGSFDENLFANERLRLENRINGFEMEFFEQRMDERK